MARIPTTFFLVAAFGLTMVSCTNGPTGPESSETEPPLLLEENRGGDNSSAWATLSQQLNAVRNATRTYRHVTQARADGYVAISPYVPGMGFHFAAESPPFGTTLEAPGVLVYFTNGSYNPAPGQEHDPAHDDDLILGAVEYLVPGDQTGDPPNIFMDETSARHLKVTEAEGWHFESKLDFTGLHVWVHRGNPAGVFHTTNPDID